MRRLFLLIVLLLSLSVQTFAYQPNPNRWEWITSTDTASFYMEKNSTVSKGYSYTDIYCWLLIIKPDEDTYSMSKHVFRHPQAKSGILYIADYKDSTGKIIKSYDFSSNPDFNLIPPESIAENMYQRLKAKHKLY